MAKKYDENSIKVLKGPDKIRKNLGMYVGGVEQGHFTIIKEILDNAIDESHISKGKNVFIDIEQDGTITVADEGRGIPIKNHKDFPGVSTLVVIFTELHAGGKFDADDGATIGTHGVGATATNALSEYFYVKTKRDGAWWGQKFERGKPISRPARIKYAASGAKKNITTAVSFRHDPQIFGKMKVKPAQIIDAVRVASYFNKGVTFHVSVYDSKASKNSATTHKFLSKNGIVDYIDHLTVEKKLTAKWPVFYVATSDVNAALSWTSLEDELTLSYVSASQTANGGTHVDELNKVIFDALKKVGGKKVEKIKPALLRSGLLGIVNVRVKRPAFSSQTKERLISPEARQMVRTAFDPLVTYFKKNKELVREIVERAQAVGAAEETFKLSKKAAAELRGPRGKKLLPKKLCVSTTKNANERELFLVEGDSAKGSGDKARDAYYQEVLALRGKFTNPWKAKEASVFKDETVLSIFQSIGFQPDKDDPLASLRVGRIILLSDADEDGKHINTLIVALLSKYAPKLFEMDMVWAIDAPLYKMRIGDKNVYSRTLEGIRKLGKGRPTRFKGWGEANADELRDIAFDPNKRKMFKLGTVDKKSRDSIRAIMGDDVNVRKELLGLAV